MDVNQQDSTAATETRKVQIPAGLTNVEMVPQKFFFKKDKETDYKRPTVELSLPFLTLEGVVDIIEKGDKKEIDLLLQQVNQLIVDQARVQVNDNEDITQDSLDHTKLTWEAIANLPQAERRGGGIAKETWEEFGKDYAAVMAEAAGKTAEQLEKHLNILLKKFAPIKSNKKVLAGFKDFLDTYVANTKNLEEFQECVEFLQTKADNLIAADDSALLDNL